MLHKFQSHSPKVHDSCFIAPTAVLIGNTNIGKDSSVWFNAVLRGDLAEISTGERSNIQDSCVLHVDINEPLIIGNDVTVGHGVILHACKIESNTRIGMGAIVLNGAVVKEGAMVAAGALVPPGMCVEKNTLVVGIPAKQLRIQDQKAIDDISRNAKSYQKLMKEYL